MNIAFDLDDILASFQLGWIEYNNRNYNLHLTYEDFTDFDYTKVMLIDSVEVFRRIFEFYESDIFNNLQPVPGAKNVLQKLHTAGHKLYIITSRSPEIKDKTQAWVERHFTGCFTAILFSGQIARHGFDHKITKTDLCVEYNVDYLVEDAPMHAESVAVTHKVILIEKPWNRNYMNQNKNIFRIKNISDLPPLLAKK